MRILIMSLALSLSMGAMCQPKVNDPKLQKQIAKDAAKEAKRLEKEGWKTTGLPLVRQLERYYTYMYDFDENNHPNYFFGLGVSVGGNYDSARMQATELARSEIGRSKDSDGTSLIENLMGNEQVDKGEATALATMMGELKVFSSQQLKGVMTVVEAYRDLPNRNKEVYMRLAQRDSASDMLEMAKSALRDEIKKRSMELSDKAMKLLSEKK